MAYINAAEVKKIRECFKAAFPGFKFSIRKEDHCKVIVTVLSGPVDLTMHLNGGYRTNYDVNQYHMYQYCEHQELFNTMIDIIKRAGRTWYDKSDAQVDYFDTAFYFNLRVGMWSKPYEVKPYKKFNEETYIADARGVLDVHAAFKELA